MTAELKDQRVVTMMTPGELAEIDDWMFSKRIRSRGEAIRRLCQMAMLMEPRVRTLEDKARHILLDEKFDSMEILGIGCEPAEPSGPRVREHLDATHAALMDITNDAVTLGAIATGVSDPVSIEDAIAQAVDVLAQANSLSEELGQTRTLPYFGKYPADTE